MAGNTVLGKIGGALANPVDALTAATNTQGFNSTFIGRAAGTGAQLGNIFGLSQSAAGLAKAPPINPPPLPADATPQQIADAADTGAAAQQAQRGRSANSLSGPSGSLTSSANLQSAGRQLLGS